DDIDSAVTHFLTRAIKHAKCSFLIRQWPNDVDDDNVNDKDNERAATFLLQYIEDTFVTLNAKEQQQTDVYDDADDTKKLNTLRTAFDVLRILCGCECISLKTASVSHRTDSFDAQSISAYDNVWTTLFKVTSS